MSAFHVTLSAAEINAQMARFDRHLGAQVPDPAAVQLPARGAWTVPGTRGGPSADELEDMWLELLTTR